MGKIKTYLIDNQLIELLSGDYALMGNGIDKLKKIKDYSFIQKKLMGPIELKSNYFINNVYQKNHRENFLELFILILLFKLDI